MLIAIFVALAIIGATIKTKSPHHNGPPTRPQSPTTGPGSTSHPIRIGRYGKIGRGWEMKVESVMRNVSQKTLGLDTPLPAGAENVVVKISAKYVGGGSGTTQAVVDQIRVVGRHRVAYQADQASVCIGNAEFGDGGVSVFSGHSTAGFVCFQIASNDAASLRLFVYPPAELPVPAAGRPRVWFDLRR